MQGAVLGRYQDAIGRQREAVAIFEMTLGPEHPSTATALNQLAVILLRLARYDEAGPLVERALNIRMHALGPDHPDMIPILENLLAIYEHAGDQTKADAVRSQIAQLQKQFGARKD